ncbi:MAG: D-glycerate dehydrogenase [Paracoccaceae bacterium]
MSAPRIIVTRKLPDAVEARLKRHFTVALNPHDKRFTREKMIAAMQNADGMLVAVGDPLDAEVMAAGGKRRAQILANFGVGTNHIDLEAATEQGIHITNTPDVLTDATADLALTLMLNVTRRTWMHENRLRRGEWGGFSLVDGLGTGLQGKTLGIIGMGRIGTAVALRAYYGFGMKVVYFNRSKVEVQRIPGAQRMDTVEDLIEASDILSLHCPGGEANRGLLSANRIALMKPTAFLINTARGDIVDEPALVAALLAGKIAGAGLDVFAKEPRVPNALRELENVCLLPHIGSATVETRTAMGMTATANLIAHFAGKDLPNKV